MTTRPLPEIRLLATGMSWRACWRTDRPARGCQYSPDSAFKHVNHPPMAGPVSYKLHIQRPLIRPERSGMWPQIIVLPDLWERSAGSKPTMLLEWRGAFIDPAKLDRNIEGSLLTPHPHSYPPKSAPAEPKSNSSKSPRSWSWPNQPSAE